MRKTSGLRPLQGRCHSRRARDRARDVATGTIDYYTLDDDSCEDAVGAELEDSAAAFSEASFNWNSDLKLYSDMDDGMQALDDAESALDEIYEGGEPTATPEGTDAESSMSKSRFSTRPNNLAGNSQGISNDAPADRLLEVDGPRKALKSKAQRQSGALKSAP